MTENDYDSEIPGSQMGSQAEEEKGKKKGGEVRGVG